AEDGIRDFHVTGVQTCALPICLLVHESDRAHCRTIMRKVAEGGAAEDFEMRLVREDGRVCWVACHWRRMSGEGATARLRMSAEEIGRASCRERGGRGGVLSSVR